MRLHATDKLETAAKPPRRSRDKQTQVDRQKDAIADSAGHFASIGLPETVGWYVSAALYWVAGVTVLVIERASEGALVSQTIGILATVTLALSPLLVIGARLLPTIWWGPHLRILLPLLILGVGAFEVGDAIGSLVLITTFPILAVAYLHRPRIALPYCLFAIVNVIAAIYLFDNGPATGARILTVGGVLTLITCGLVYAQDRLRHIAALNHTLAVTDPLTGLANLRRLQTRLRQEIQRSIRTHNTIVLFAIDLDDFKLVNDRFSYDLGDRVLKAVAESLAAQMTPGDLLVRRGGDEFAVLTIDVADRDLDQFKAQLGHAIATARKAVCPEVNPSGSVSYIVHRVGESAERFLQRVDDGLHDAKLEAHPERRELELHHGHALPTVPDFSTNLGLDDKIPASYSAAGASAHIDRSPLPWQLTTWALGASAAMIAISAVTGISPDLRSTAVMACVLGIGLCAGFAWTVRSRLKNHWIHLPLSVSLILTTVVIAEAGISSTALLELYAIHTPLVIYFLGWRAATPYAVVSAFLYSDFLLASDEPFVAVRIAVFVAAMTVLCVMLAQGQRTTADFSRRAADLSVIDPLTGVANLRGLQRRTEDEIDRCRLVGGQIGVIGIDLVGFKSVNDRHNHSMGDRVLAAVAHAIRDTVREDELVARRGGDEFMVVFVPEAHSDVNAFIRRISRQIKCVREALTPELQSDVTTSFVLWDQDESCADLLRRADQALHGAKERANTAQSIPAQEAITPLKTAKSTAH